MTGVRRMDPFVDCCRLDGYDVYNASSEHMVMGHVDSWIASSPWWAVMRTGRKDSSEPFQRNTMPYVLTLATSSFSKLRRLSVAYSCAIRESEN